MRLLSAIALLAFACHARAQTNECPQITKEILTTTDESTGSTLVVQAFNPAINPSDPFILVDDIHIVCQAVGETRDTYRSVSVLVRQNCSGFLCPANQPNFNAVIQYDFDCFFGKWRAMDTNVVDSDPEADFDTALRENCGVCSENTVGAEPITHCRRKWHKFCVYNTCSCSYVYTYLYDEPLTNFSPQKASGLSEVCGVG